VKPLRRVSGLLTFAAFVCFLPCAFGQSTVNLRAAGTVHTILSLAPSNSLAFVLTSGDDFFSNDKKHKNNDGCDSRDNYKGSKCAAVPEGGTSLMYLLLAGLSCLGGIVLRSRRQVSMRQIH
jgi:hypothetical protein